MEQKKLNYSDVTALGFTTEKDEDQGDFQDAFFKKYGYSHSYIQMDLPHWMFLEWEQETRMCFLVRTVGQGAEQTERKMPIRDLNHLKEVIAFFTDEAE